MNPRNGYDIEDMAIGMSAETTKTITDADIVLFAGVSTDFNAVHMDEEYARTTPFGGRIAHGMLSASLLSAVLGGLITALVSAARMFQLRRAAKKNLQAALKR